MTDLLALTASLVDIRSESHHEGPITDHLENILRAVPWLQVDRLGHNLVARTSLGRAQRLILAGHSDTVPVNLNHPSTLDGDVLRGCGSADMKGGLAVMVELARTVAEPVVDVTYVFYEAEEVASEFNGLGRLFRERAQWLAGDVAILGEPTDGDIEAGCQGSMRAVLTVSGHRAHTARPWMGRNAVHRLAGPLERLAGYHERRPIIDGLEFREAMSAVAVSGGVAGNVVPDSATLTVNHRFAPDRSAAEAEAHMRSVVAPSLEPDDRFEIVDCAPAAQPGLTHPLLRALIDRNQLEVRAKLGWTDVARFAEHGIPAVNFGPGDATIAHTRDELLHRAPLERVFTSLKDLLTAI
ncbi:MAG: succinyl-diaminopimelate desuccinylase [Acidimicrobiia bacterium]